MCFLDIKRRKNWEDEKRETHLMDGDLIGNPLLLIQLIRLLSSLGIQPVLLLLLIKSIKSFSDQKSGFTSLFPLLAALACSPARLIGPVLLVGVCPEFSGNLKLCQHKADIWRVAS